MSTYDLLGIPSEVGVMVFAICLAIALAPYLGGKEIGPLTVPAFDAGTAKRLKWFGWPLVVVALGLFTRVWGSDEPAPFDVRIRFESSNGAAIECGRLATATATLRVQTQSYSQPIDAKCEVTFRTLPPPLRNQQAGLEITGAPGFVLVSEGTQPLLPDREWTAKLDDARTVPRLRISLLPYKTPALEAELQQFREALSGRIIAMSQLLVGRGLNFGYVTRLKVHNDGPEMPSVDELKSFWNASHALQLVRGEVRSTQPLTVHGTIYLGDLAPGPLQLVELDVSVTPGDFARAQDAYSVVMLYSLARDAHRLKMPPDVIAGLLGDAHGIAQQVDDPRGQLAPVSAAIVEMLRELATSGATP
jgi:hypothetical protein